MTNKMNQGCRRKNEIEGKRECGDRQEEGRKETKQKQIKVTDEESWLNII